MTDPEPEPKRHLSDVERLVALFEPLVTADSLGVLLERGVGVVGELTGAVAVAIFVTDGDSIVHEAWRPEDESRRGRLRPHLLGLTHESVRIGEPTVLPFPARTASGLSPHVSLLRARGRTFGTLCCVFRSGGPEERASREALAGRLANLIANQIATLRDQSDWRAGRAQHERWFRQLDQHIRVLDRERQKFAALVNQEDVYVFVTDAEHNIRWVNRALGKRFPVEGKGSTWIGKRCMELCTFLSGGDLDGACPVERALESNQPAHQEFRKQGPDGDRSLYVTALPIKGPDGRPHEVIVMLQDLSDIEKKRKSEVLHRAGVAKGRKAA